MIAPRITIPKLFVVVAAMSMAGCASGPADSARFTDLPLASAYSNLSYSVMSGSREGASCVAGASCQTQSDGTVDVRFIQQVQRVADTLQKGAQKLYPDLAQRVPKLANGRFDVYVVEGGEPGSASSGNGRIVLTSALGYWQSYEEWLAFVIAREMGHVIAQHNSQNTSNSIVATVIMNVIVPGSSLLKNVASASGSSIASTRNRDEQVREADAIAFALLEASGYHLRTVSRSLMRAPVMPDVGLWASDFRNSFDSLIDEIHRSELAAKSAKQAAPIRQVQARDSEI